jgi:hypothetical protein
VDLGCAPVELVLHRSFEHICQHGHIVAVARRGGIRSEFNKTGLNIAEIARRQSPLEEIRPSYRARGWRLLLGGGS